MRTDQINTDPFQSHAQRQAISRTVVNQPLKAFPRSSAMNSRRANRLQRILDQLRFMRRRGSNAYPDWYALTICYHHNFCSLAAFGFADARPPFFAGENVLSAKTSSQSKRPCASNIPRNVCQISIQTFCACHLFIRRQHALPDGKRLGISFLRAPLKRIQRIRSIQARLVAQILTSSEDRLGEGRRGSNLLRCSSVNSVPVTYARFS